MSIEMELANLLTSKVNSLFMVEVVDSIEPQTTSFLEAIVVQDCNMEVIDLYLGKPPINIGSLIFSEAFQ